VNREIRESQNEKSLQPSFGAEGSRPERAVPRVSKIERGLKVILYKELFNACVSLPVEIQVCQLVRGEFGPEVEMLAIGGRLFEL
jgi:hypothetical protein